MCDANDFLGAADSLGLALLGLVQVLSDQDEAKSQSAGPTSTPLLDTPVLIIYSLLVA